MKKSLTALSTLLLAACATSGGQGGAGGYAGQGCDRLAAEHATLSKQYAALSDRQNGVAPNQTNPPKSEGPGRDRLVERLTDVQTRLSAIESQAALKGCPPLPMG